MPLTDAEREDAEIITSIAQVSPEEAMALIDLQLDYYERKELGFFGRLAKAMCGE